MKRKSLLALLALALVAVVAIGARHVTFIDGKKTHAFIVPAGDGVLPGVLTVYTVDPGGPSDNDFDFDDDGVCDWHRVTQVRFLQQVNITAHNDSLGLHFPAGWKDFDLGPNTGANWINPFEVPLKKMADIENATDKTDTVFVAKNWSQFLDGCVQVFGG